MIEDIFRRIGNKKYFTTLDVSNAFWQIPLVEESRQYVGFMFNGQSYVLDYRLALLRQRVRHLLDA